MLISANKTLVFKSASKSRPREILSGEMPNLFAISRAVFQRIRFNQLLVGQFTVASSLGWKPIDQGRSSSKSVGPVDGDRSVQSLHEEGSSEASAFLPKLASII